MRATQSHALVRLIQNITQYTKKNRDKDDKKSTILKKRRMHKPMFVEKKHTHTTYIIMMLCMLYICIPYSIKQSCIESCLQFAI